MGRFGLGVSAGRRGSDAVRGAVAVPQVRFCTVVWIEWPVAIRAPGMNPGERGTAVVTVRATTRRVRWFRARAPWRVLEHWPAFTGRATAPENVSVAGRSRPLHDPPTQLRVPGPWILHAHPSSRPRLPDRERRHPRYSAGAATSRGICSTHVVRPRTRGERAGAGGTCIPASAPRAKC